MQFSEIAFSLPTDAVAFLLRLLLIHMQMCPRDSCIFLAIIRRNAAAQHKRETIKLDKLGNLFGSACTVAAA